LLLRHIEISVKHKDTRGSDYKFGEAAKILGGGSAMLL